MKNVKIVDYFQFNLLRLKNRINKMPREETEEVSLIIFNNIINHFPNDKWYTIKEKFGDYISIKSPQWIINYTILAYNLGPQFINSHPSFIEDLCDVFTKYKISPYKLTKYAEFFLYPSMYDTIIAGLTKKGIPPKYIIRLVLENFDLGAINHLGQKSIYQTTQKFVDAFSYQIFDGNYSFFNVYRCLKRIWDYYLILELPDLNFQDIELLLELEEIPDENTKKKIRNDFAAIEEKDSSIAEKFQDSLTVIIHYSYDLPTYLPSKMARKEKSNEH